MANEWTKVELYGANNDGTPIRYTIADGLSVSKGQLLELADDRTVIATTFQGPIAGVAREAHLPDKGVTTISLWSDGIFRVTSSGSIAIGDPLTSAGAVSNNVTASAALLTNTQAYLLSHGSIRALDAVSTDTELSVRLKL